MKTIYVCVMYFLMIFCGCGGGGGGVQHGVMIVMVTTADVVINVVCRQNRTSILVDLMCSERFGFQSIPSHLRVKMSNKWHDNRD